MKAGRKTDLKICVGQFVGAHGVRGLIKLRSFTAEPDAIFDYAPLCDEEGREVKVTYKSTAKDIYLVVVEGISSKEEADALRGDRLYITRRQLPKTKQGEYYEAELIGLKAHDEDGKSYGTVMDVHDHGAGVFLEIGTTRKDSFMLPFRSEFVGDVDIAQGTIEIVIPKGWL